MSECQESFSSEDLKNFKSLYPEYFSDDMPDLSKSKKNNFSNLEIDITSQVQCISCKSFYYKNEFYWMKKVCECDICADCQAVSELSYSKSKCMECQLDLNDEHTEYLHKKWIELYQIQSKICEICLLPKKTNKFIRLIDSNRNFCKSCFYAFPNECFNHYS